jgi:hypothetical protein
MERNFELFSSACEVMFGKAFHLKRSIVHKLKVFYKKDDQGKGVGRGIGFHGSLGRCGGFGFSKKL